MYNILLVGSGQLGSRYLQGLSRINNDLEIFVVDPNLNALSIAKDRFEEMTKNTFSHSVNYYQDFNELGNEFDLGIIATNAEDEERLQSRIPKFEHRKDIEAHSECRDVECALIATKRAAALANYHDNRLHIVLLTSGKEADWLASNKKKGYMMGT